MHSCHSPRHYLRLACLEFVKSPHYEGMQDIFSRFGERMRESVPIGVGQAALAHTVPDQALRLRQLL